MKRILALCLSLALLFSLIPLSSAATGQTDTYTTLQQIQDRLAEFNPSGASARKIQQQAQALTDEDYREADDIFARISKMEAAPEKKNRSAEELTDAAEAIVLASKNYVEGSLERNGNSFTWWTDEGIRCIYSPSMREKYANMQAPENREQDIIYNEPPALRASAAAKKQVYLIGPYYGYDESFSDQYKTEAKTIAAAIGDTDGYTLYSGKSATIEKVATAVENGAVVIFDSHGTTDYDGDLMCTDPYGYRVYDYVSKATESYLCLTNKTGLTTADYEDGAAYFVDADGMTCACINGETIVNHMDKASPSGLLWMAMCLGMATDSFWEPLRNYGVEVVYGYSQSITFAMDYLYAETFWDNLLAGSSVADAIGAMKNKWGLWDYSSQMCDYYDFPIAYTSITDARKYHASFPVVVSDEDFYPGQRNRVTGFYGSCSTQQVKSSYTLEKPYGIADLTNAEENYKTLAYYINRYGESTDTGNKCLAQYVEAEGMEHYFLLTNLDDGIEFDYLLISQGEESVASVTSFVLKPNSGIIDVNMALDVSAQDTLIDTLSVIQNINCATLTTASAYKIYESSTYISSDTATEYFNLTLHLLCDFWDETLYNTLGFGLYRLGFDIYDGLGNEDPDSSYIPQGLCYEIANGIATITGYTGSAETLVLPDVIEGCYVTTIAQDAFFECTDLTSVTLGCNVTTIGDSAFAFCTGLKNIHILRRVTSIGYLAFFGCESMTEFIVAADNPAYTTGWGGILYSKDRTTLIQAPGGFNGMISVPYSVTTIADYAFYGTKLYEIVISASVVNIGEGAFSWCEALTSVTMYHSVRSIGDFAFSHCTKLKTITIPENVASIGTGAFMGCSNLTQIKVHEANAFFSNDTRNVLFNKDQTVLLQAPGGLAFGYTTPEHTTAIAGYAFSGCNNITNITFFPSLTSIAEGAFDHCSGLTDVYYNGTTAQWNTIKIGSNNQGLLSADLFCLDSDTHTCSYIWTVTKEPTFTSEGEKVLHCPECGTILETAVLDMLVGEVAQWNISLYNEFRIRFVLKLSDNPEEAIFVYTKIGDDTFFYQATELDRHKDGYYFVYADVAASQMNEPISIWIESGNAKTEVSTYTVSQYCQMVLSDPLYAAYHPLVKEMLHYGAMAQQYFGYNTQNLPNEGITGTAAAAVPETTDKLTINDHSAALDFYGASLIYQDQIAVRFYFAGDVSGLTFTVNGKTYDPHPKGDMFYIDVTDILPQNLDQQITVTVTGSGNTLTVTYGPMNYIVRMYAGADEKTQNLLRALYNYHLAAKAL